MMGKNQPLTPENELIIYTAASICDGAGVWYERSGESADCPAIAMCGQTVWQVGRLAEVRRSVEAVGCEVQVVDRPGAILIPGLVNAHVHLDLTLPDQLAYEGDFCQWVQAVRALRGADRSLGQEGFERGLAMSLASGVMTFGDIAGQWEDDWLDQLGRSSIKITQNTGAEALGTCQKAGLAFREFRGGTGFRGRGVRFVELFGLAGPRLNETLERLAQRIQTLAPGRLDNDRRQEACDVSEPIRFADGWQLGLQPHAPYSAGPELYRYAMALSEAFGLPVSTHLAENQEEISFVQRADGRFRDMLRAMQLDDSVAMAAYGQGQQPIAWLAEQLKQTADDLNRKAAPLLSAHCNYLADGDVERLKRLHAVVAYCPRASDYFNHQDHPYQTLLEFGVPVCLGTDSILCHGSLSIFDEMRYLYQRDQTAADVLLQMATINGLEALGLPVEAATFAVGASPGLVAVDCHDGQWATALGAKKPPSLEVLAWAS